MPFLGRQPTSIPLTSSDITDGIISTAKIADDAVTGAKIENTPSIANGLTLTDGNLVVASGHGIDFSSASGSASGSSSALLEDYEEGTFTPTWSGYSDINSTSGKYVKIGNYVTVYTKLVTGTGNDSSAVSITNLPFTITSDFGGGSVYHNQVNLRDQHIVTAFNSNSTVCSLFGETGGADTTIKYVGTNPQIGASSTLVWILHYATL